MRQEARAPQRGALAPWGKIGARVHAGKAEPHRRDRDHGVIVEGRTIDPHPRPKPIAGSVVERKAALVHAPPGRLAGDEDARACACAHDRARLVAKVWRTDLARPDFRQELL